MQDQAFTQEQVVEMLRQNHLLLCYISGGVAIHNEKKIPLPGYCPLEVFKSLCTAGLIEQTDRLEFGYPYSTGTAKYFLYRITARGRILAGSSI